MVLKQSALAEACGFIGSATVPLPDAEMFARGGWIYIDLDESSDYSRARAGFRSVYAARLPALSSPRPLYAPVLFPVDGAAPVDDLYREAERYSGGFARMVHGEQSEDSDAIRLAWDDEQVAEWFNRQVDPALNAPMGTSGFRVDVRREGDNAWKSLQRIASVRDLELGGRNLGPFAGEAVVEVAPVQMSAALRGQYWMPSYFATWRGSSLALTDADLVSLHQDPALDGPEAQAHRLGRERVFEPVDDKAVPLLYGQTYEFRVRLADLTRGGPASDDVGSPAPDSTAIVPFRRRRQPEQVAVLSRPSKAAPVLELAKPRLRYPEALFTGKVSVQDLRSDFLSAPEREFGVPDPDIVVLDILVEVRALNGDAMAWLPLYRTTRPFDADAMTLQMAGDDTAVLAGFAGNEPEDGALRVPTARDIRLTFTAIGRDGGNYFESEAARTGIPISVEVRAGAAAEASLLTIPDTPLRSFFFQPPPADGSVASPVERVAAELGVDCSRLTLAGRAGRRTVFGASAELHHTLTPEGSAITFASNADLIRRWVNVVRVTLSRDWTWDGLSGGLAIRRTIRRKGADDVDALAGTVLVPRVIAGSSRAGIAADPRAPQRQFTEICFFDAFDPKPVAGEFPQELHFEYRIEAAFAGDPPAPEPVILPELRAPVTTPPAQTPKLVSAGLALSEFVAADDYSSTTQRARSLWIELEAKPADPEDAYFVRILADAPDPMLVSENIPEVQELPLALDPEWMRFVVAAQPRDSAGLDSMVLLDQHTPDLRHWIVPLPNGMSVGSPELFGMYTYEIRVGHTDERWSTAQGRFGPPLRVAGVQHPSPPLLCQAARVTEGVRIRAPFATPVYKGRNMRPQVPRTQLWAVLYARVRQMDGVSWRNLALTRAPLLPPATIFNAGLEANAAVLFGEGQVAAVNLQQLLRAAGLPADTPLTVLAVELFGAANDVNPAPDPLGLNLGFARMLRVSPLSPVPDAC
jgi:hypothetical protein